MKCNRYQKYLIPYAEGALSGKLQKFVEKHLSACKLCAEELIQVRRTVDVLRQTEYPAMEPAFDLRSRVMAKIASEPAPASTRKSFWGAYSAAAAALLIFAVVMVAVQPVFYRSRQAAVEQSMPRMKALTRESSAPEVKAPAMMKQPSKPEGTRGDVTAKKSSDGFYLTSPSAPPPAAPEERPHDMAQADFGGGQQASQAPAGPAPMFQAEKVEATPKNINVGFVDRAEEKADDDGKILELERKLREFPNSRTALTELLKAYRDAGRSEDEYAIAERLTKLDADNPQYWFACAQAAERAGKPQTAAAAYRQAIQLNLSGPDLELAKSRLEVLEKN